MEKALFISIKPEFVEKILDGTKVIELRKSAPKVNRGDLVILYSSSPIKAISGTCKIEEIVTLSPALLWRRYSHILGIDRKRYFDYYEGKEFAVGIILKDIKKSKSEISLSKLRQKFSNFHPPQTFRYFDSKQIDKLNQ